MAAAVAASRLGPASGDQVPLPPQDRGKGDDPLQVASLGQPPGQRRKHRSVCPRQAGAADLATQHGHLMPQHQNLRVLRTCAMGRSSNQAMTCRKTR